MIDWQKYVAQMAFALALFGAGLVLLAISGCASTGESRSDQKRTQHEVVIEKSQLPVTGADGAVQLVPVIKTTERWMDEGVRTTSNDERHTTVDVPAIAAVAAPIIQGASGLGVGQVAGGLATLALTTAAGWLARQGSVKTLKDQVDYHRKDAEEGWRKADERALKLPPEVA